MSLPLRLEPALGVASRFSHQDGTLLKWARIILQYQSNRKPKNRNLPVYTCLAHDALGEFALRVLNYPKGETRKVAIIDCG